MSRVTIVGGGLSGPMLAIFLARRGFEVDVYEARSDPREDDVFQGKSINLTIAERGMDALRRVGLDDAVMTNFCTPLRGRAVHHLNRPVQFIEYGIRDSELLWAVSRAELTRFLCQVAEDEPRVRLHFNQRCVELDKRVPEVTVRDTVTGEHRVVSSELVVGADGVHSEVRRFLQHGEFADFSEYYVPWRYKELGISGPTASLPGLDRNYLHIWPRGRFMMFALPNRTEGFNGVCVLPEQGADSIHHLGSPEAVGEFFARNFPDVVPYMPALADEFTSRPPSAFATIRTSRWHYQDKVVLIGDACHGVIPFYGQGMNAAFEDCVVLDQSIARDWHNRSAALRNYKTARKVNTDALAELSISNFEELRDSMREPHRAARKRVGLALNRVLGERFRPLHALVSHTTIPYSECVNRARRAERVATVLGVDAWAWGWVAVNALTRLAKPPTLRGDDGVSPTSS